MMSILLTIKTIKTNIMKAIIIENTWLSRSLGTDFGWGNGYVIIPKSHPLHGKHYDDIDVSVHGGLTFSELIDINTLKKSDDITTDDLGSWMIGFDTAHYGDSLVNWSRSRVREEADRLLEQLKQVDDLRI